MDSQKNQNTENEICMICHGSGWASTDIKGTVRRCDCQIALRIEQLLEKARIPARYKGCELDGYGPLNSSQKTAKMLVQKFLDNYPPLDEKDRGIIFIGPCGVGKTHLAVSLLKNVIKKKGDSGLFYDFRDLLREIQGTWNPASQTSELEILRPVIDAKVLVLDELGANKPTAWVRDTVSHIINCRYNERKITIFTSNFLDRPAKEGEETLTDRIDTRLRSRLYEMCHTVEIKGNDFRQDIKKASF
jgi:DNA replication protein DnaC